MEWSEKYSIGITTIDSQHKELFRRINALVTAIKEHRCKEEIDKTIEFLEDYARLHFSDEQEHMKKTGYPGYEEQHTEHKQFIASLADLKFRASLPRIAGSSYDLSAATNQVVVDWIVSHIVKLDMKFGGFLRSRGQHT